jgi:hypothetical protein
MSLACTTGQPAIVPPTPSTSSSGWAAMTTTLGQACGLAAGSCHSSSQDSQASSGCRAGRCGSVRPGPVDPGDSPCNAAVGHQRTELSQVTLGVMLPEVHGEIGDPAPVRLFLP